MESIRPSPVNTLAVGSPQTPLSGKPEFTPVEDKDNNSYHPGSFEDTNGTTVEASRLAAGTCYCHQAHPGLELRFALGDSAAGQVVCFSKPQLPYL